MKSIFDQLTGHWRHSHEEDDPNGVVFRPISYPFPPSRGRVEFELLGDGQACYCPIGSGDQQQMHPCRWHVDQRNQDIYLTIESPTGCFLKAQIVNCQADRIQIRYGDLPVNH